MKIEKLSVPAVSVKSISKEFPGVRALSDVSIDFWPGKVHVLIGENGAGKSTLIKMLSGVYSVDSGVIEYKGKKTIFDSPSQAIDAGISVIHQELSVVPDLSVAENIFLGREPKRGVFIDKKKMYKRAREILQELDTPIDPRKHVSTLSTAQMQVVEIARAVSQNASLIIMDEPTSSISDHEVASLFRTIGKLKANGVAIIYISHRLKELFEIGDTVSVLRDGTLVKTLPINEINTDQLVSLMVGREITNYFTSGHNSRPEVVLEVKGLTRKGVYNNISFSLHKGELLGIAGLLGAGRTEVLRGIFGADSYDNGEITLFGKKVSFSSPKQAIRAGVGLVPEDRRTQGVILSNDVKTNISLPSLHENGIFINKAWERQTADEYIKKLLIKTPSSNALVGNLSGGNQQKVVIAKWIVAKSKILLLDELTRGIDVNAKAEIYALIEKFTSAGGSVLMVSSELPELLGVCNNIMVMREGTISGVLSADEATEEKLMRLASIQGGESK